MERDEPTIKGWQAFKGSFLFGVSAQTPQQQETDESTDATYSRESIGDGCYCAACDFDKLDQQ